MSNYIIDYLTGGYAGNTFVKEAGFVSKFLRRFLPGVKTNAVTTSPTAANKSFMRGSSKIIRRPGKDAFTSDRETLEYLHGLHYNNLRDLVDVRRRLRPNDIPRAQWNKDFRTYVQRLQDAPPEYASKYADKNNIFGSLPDNVYDKLRTMGNPILGYFSAANHGFMAKYKRLLDKQKALANVPNGVGSVPNVVYNNRAHVAYDRNYSPYTALESWQGSPRTTSMTENLANAIQKDTAWNATLPKISGSSTRDGSFMYPTPYTSRALSGLGF